MDLLDDKVSCVSLRRQGVVCVSAMGVHLRASQHRQQHMQQPSTRDHLMPRLGTRRK